MKTPQKGSGGAYLAFKRSAPVYPTASAAVQLTMEGDTCKDAAIVLGCVGLTAMRATDSRSSPAWAAGGRQGDGTAMEAARAAVDPQSDMRGSAEYKRILVGALVKRAIAAALRRARGRASRGEPHLCLKQSKKSRFN